MGKGGNFVFCQRIVSSYDIGIRKSRTWTRRRIGENSCGKTVQAKRVGVKLTCSNLDGTKD